MKQLFPFFSAALLAGASVFYSCSEDNGGGGGGGTTVPEDAMDAVIATYVDRTVIPTYALMEERVSDLKTKVDKFVNDGTQASLDAACSAWRAAREPWELSEAFLFGPADYEGLDPSLDSWPLDKNGIDQILASVDFSQIEGDSESAQSLRGFHTIEYLLFEGGQNKQAQNITANEKQYMAIVADILLSDTQKLHSAWTDSFGDEFKTHTSDRFPSANASLEQIIDGCMTIASEVGSDKIGEPAALWMSGQQEKGLHAVESWYSWNSLVDYVNNIVSIENSYMGGCRGNRDAATSFSALVKSVDEDLDTKIQLKIAEAISKVQGIPAPFRNHLDATTEIEAAQAALSELSDALLEIKAALNLN